MKIPHQSATNQLDDAAFAAIQALILDAVQQGIAPAVTLAIYKDDALLLDAGWGWHDPETPANPVTPESYFDLASVTKIFTTIAVLTQLSADQIALDTPLVALVPEFGTVNPRPIDGGQDPHSKQRQPVNEVYAGQTVDPSTVTLFHLLTHTSGLPPWRDVYTVAPPPPPATESDPVGRGERWSRAVERLCHYPFVAPPDTGIRYSDIGLMLLGEALSRMAGKPLDAIIAQTITVEALFRPAEDHKIALDQIVPTEIDMTWRKRRVHGQVHDENACGVGGVAGHAGLFAQARTVAETGRRWLARDYAISDDLYDAAVSLQAQTGNEVRGLGWMLRSMENSSSGDHFSAASYGHTGFTGTSLWIDPVRKLVVALLTNRVYPGREVVGIHALRRAVHDAIVRAVD